MTVIPLPLPAEPGSRAGRRQTWAGRRQASASRPQATPQTRRDPSEVAFNAGPEAMSETEVVGAAAAETRADVSGTLTSPTGRVGRMSGQARVRHIDVKEGQLCATVVFTGQLYDADGSAIGTGSRRVTALAAPAEGSHGRAAVIGPVEVDLLGLSVSIRAFIVGINPGAPG